MHTCKIQTSKAYFSGLNTLLKTHVKVGISISLISHDLIVGCYALALSSCIQDMAQICFYSWGSIHWNAWGNEKKCNTSLKVLALCNYRRMHLFLKSFIYFFFFFLLLYCLIPSKMYPVFQMGSLYDEMIL